MPTMTPVDSDPFAPTQSRLTPVDHDPFAQTSPGATSAPISPSAPGAVGQASSPGAQASSFDPNWKPSGNALWDFLSRPRAQTEGFGQAANDAVRAVTDAATFGGADRLASYMSGTDLAQERAQTQAAHQRLGLMDYPTAALGYAAVPGTGVLGGVTGGIAEGAAAGGLGALGHDQNVTGGALTGGLGGLAGGVLGKAAGGIANKIVGPPDVNAAAGKITSALGQNTTDQYQALKTVPYSDVGQAAANARAEIEANYPGGPKGSTMQQAAPRTMGVLANIDRSTAPSASQALSGQDAANYLLSQRGTMSPDDYTSAWGQLANTGEITPPGQTTTLTGHDILTSLDKLRDIQGPMAGAENDLAPIVEKHLNNVLANSAPTNGMPVGTGAQMLNAAKQANKLSQSASGLQTAAADLRDFGTSPASWAQDQAKYWPQGSDQYKALSNIANSGGAPGGQSAYTVTHGVVHPLVEGLALATLPPAVAPAAAAMATFMGAKPLLNKAMGDGSTASQLNSIYKAYPTLTRRQFTPPSGPDPGAALRALILGQASSNQKPF